jgi:hypothetical protein
MVLAIAIAIAIAIASATEAAACSECTRSALTAAAAAAAGAAAAPPTTTQSQSRRADTIAHESLEHGQPCCVCCGAWHALLCCVCGGRAGGHLRVRAQWRCGALTASLEMRARKTILGTRHGTFNHTTTHHASSKRDYLDTHAGARIRLATCVVEENSGRTNSPKAGPLLRNPVDTA